MIICAEQDLSALTGTSAFGNRTLQVWDHLTGSMLTNASQILSWQLSFVLHSNATFASSLSAQTPTSSTIPAGQTVFFQVNVPSWAHFATNILVSSSLPVNLFFNPTNTPTGTGPGDQTLLTLSNGGVSPNPIIVNTNFLPYPPFQAGSVYFLAVQNPNTAPAQVVLKVDYDITVLTNGGPFSTVFGTNDSERYYAYGPASNAYEATFQLLKQTGNNDLVLSRGIPLPTLTNTAYGSFNAGNLDETIYVLTNSEPVPLTPGIWYLGVIKRDSGSKQLLRARAGIGCHQHRPEFGEPHQSYERCAVQFQRRSRHSGPDEFLRLQRGSVHRSRRDQLWGDV